MEQEGTASGLDTAPEYLFRSPTFFREFGEWHFTRHQADVNPLTWAGPGQSSVVGVSRPFGAYDLVSAETVYLLHPVLLSWLWTSSSIKCVYPTSCILTHSSDRSSASSYSKLCHPQWNPLGTRRLRSLRKSKNHTPTVKHRWTLNPKASQTG